MSHAVPGPMRIGSERIWSLIALVTAIAVVLPLLSLAWNAAQGSDELWGHLGRHVLPRAGLNTLVLLSGVGLLAAMLGAGSAWLVSAYQFPGRALLSWALLLPLAMPTYIIAYAYLDILHPLGPVQSLLRALLGIDSPRDWRLPDIRSLGSCIVLLGFVLYPYVYLTTRAMFLTQAGSLLEAARALGVPQRALFWRVALPLARPALAVGVVLVLLETLNDIGASEFLGVQTLTRTIYTTWVSREDLPGAAQIALGLLALISLLVGLERHARRRQRYAAGQRSRPMRARHLRGVPAGVALALGLIPVLIGFVVPALYLAWSGIARLRSHGLSQMLQDGMWNTLLVAGVATVLTVLLGLAVAFALRLAQARRRTRIAEACLRMASLGYAVPGTVLAIGLLTPLGWIDMGVNEIMQRLGAEPQLWVMGSVAALVLAYLLRFLTMSIGNADAGLMRISPSLDQAARSLGQGSGRMLWRVHLPLLKPALAAGALLVFVDAMKELPATLMLRPANFETLATWLYADAARGAYEDGAVAAFLIVLVGLVPVVLLARSGTKAGLQQGAATGEAGR